MSSLIGMVCEIVTGHRFGAWAPFTVPESQFARFQRATCHLCRQTSIRPEQACYQWMTRAGD